MNQGEYFKQFLTGELVNEQFEQTADVNPGLEPLNVELAKIHEALEGLVEEYEDEARMGNNQASFFVEHIDEALVHLEQLLRK